MLKKLIALTLIAVSSVTVIYTGFFIANNFYGESVTKQRLQDSLNRSTSWLTNNRAILLDTHNPALWEMLAKLASVSTNDAITALVTEYRNSRYTSYIGHPLAFQVYGTGKADYGNLDLSTFPYYNLLMMYGFSCNQELKQLDLVQQQLSPAFCGQHYPVSPACKTHQLMGFLYFRDNNCENTEQVEAVINGLTESISLQLWLDFRTVDVYMQRVLMLLQADKNYPVKEQWLDNILQAQNEDGGWDNFMPLIKLSPANYFGIGSKFFKISTPRSDFHATVQGALLTAIAIEQLD